jgi:hypothetical protein
MVGNPTIGAVDVVQVKGVINPTLVSEVTFTDTDISSVACDNNRIYLAEATSNPALSYTSAVEFIAINNGKLDLSKHFRRGLQSYVATSVFAGAGRVYVTTGNTGGLITLTENDTLPIQSYAPLHDARWVDGDNATIAVAQGTPGKVSVYSRATGGFLRTISVPGMSIAESKSTVRIFGGNALVAAGDSGVQLVNLTTGAVLGSIPQVLVPGLPASKTVTNAVDASGQLIFSSNGEAGVYVAFAVEPLADVTASSGITLWTLGKLQVPALQSVNHVAYDGQVLVVAAGLGGFKILTVTF